MSYTLHKCPHAGIIWIITGYNPDHAESAHHGTYRLQDSCQFSITNGLQNLPDEYSWVSWLFSPFYDHPNLKQVSNSTFPNCYQKFSHQYSLIRILVNSLRLWLLKPVFLHILNHDGRGVFSTPSNWANDCVEVMSDIPWSVSRVWSEISHYP